MTGRSVHDPVHGTIPVSAQEMRIIDAPAVQRLRFIKQLGFAEMAFPGATHSRLAHSLGAMHMAGRMFDEATATLPLGPAQRPALRQAVRAAVLLHDLGHPPLSHASEVGLPSVSTLQLGDWAPGDPLRQATHEDMTLKLILDSALTGVLQNEGLSPALVAMLILGATPAAVAVETELLTCDGISLCPLLWAIVSGELDADRMDYLRRDAANAGVSYGHFDHIWLTTHMVALAGEGGWMLGLQPRALWAFENFLLARYHMFLAVYHHHTAVAFDTMLGLWFQASEFRWPSDAQQYLGCDDIFFWHSLRSSRSRWAKELVARRPLSLIEEARQWGGEQRPDRVVACAQRLTEAGIEAFLVHSDSALSRYARPGGRRVPLVMQAPGASAAQPVDASTPLYARFAQPVRVHRLYCRPEDRVAAQARLAKI